MNKSTAEIRQTFLDFFYKKKHYIINSSSLIPNNDKTLLFTNAGMNQFKNIFLGLEKPEYSKVVTAQRCVRAGGKHNDLENVGYTNRHHTFFEMLGNFSFGDYFKYDAISFAWELLTSKKWFNLPKEKFLITIYKTDDESYEILNKKINIPTDKIIRIGDNKGTKYESDNFWQMNNTGPCGPCIEIFYDRGNHIPGDIPGGNEENNNRYIELWNIVFMQFNRQPNGTMITIPLSIDTGMGLERISSILQKVDSTYDIDIFRELISATANITKTTDLTNKSLRVIADHIRSCAFLISDGVFPSNEKRGYVLRRIIRRAILHGYKLGIKNPFFYKLITPLIKIMSITTNKIKTQQIIIEKIIKTEEEQFLNTLKYGLQLLNKEITTLKTNIIDGEIAFRLYDTYGFPIDITTDICREHNINVDIEGFQYLMKKQRQNTKKFNIYNLKETVDYNINCEFLGYKHNKKRTTINAIYKNNLLVDSLYINETGMIVLDKTPFYAESGGQVGDTGIIYNNKGIFTVTNTIIKNKIINHIGKINSGSLSIKKIVNAKIDTKKRKNTCLNHSATHLLHSTLRNELGEHIIQKGSLVNDKLLRFDFSHFKALTEEQLEKIENTINKQIRKNLKIKTELTNLEDAKIKGATSLLDYKYKKHVRIVSISDFSIELCCGTHVNRTGDIGLFSILKEYSIASGVRRIEAITGNTAIKNMHKQFKQISIIKNLLKSDKNDISKKIKHLQNKIYELEKTISQSKEQQIFQEIILLKNKSKNINGVKFIVKQLNNIDIDLMRKVLINIKNQLKSSIIILSTINNNKISIIIGVTNELTDKIKAVDLILYIVKQIDGKGGGQNDIAQGGGINTNKLTNALNNLENFINSQL